MEATWWIGVVESKDDPERRGRIKVRIQGVHPDSKFQRNDETGWGVPTDELPWVLPCFPLTYGGTTIGTVPPPAVLPGSWVLGVSLDGDAYTTNIAVSVISVAMSPVAINPNDMDLGAATQVLDEFSAEESCLDNYFNFIESIESSGSQNPSKPGAMGVMQIMPQNVGFALEYTKRNFPDKYEKFIKSSGIQISDANAIAVARENPAFNRLIGRGYYSWCLEKCNDDPILAALSYSAGYGKAIAGYNKGQNKSYIQLYGDPRKGNITYEELANRIEAGGDKNSAEYIRKFISKLGNEGMASCAEKAAPKKYDEKTDTYVPVTTAGTVVLPTQSNVITSLFGPRKVAGGSSPHKGIDLRAPMNSLIYAMMDGIVTQAVDQANYGEITIDHGNGIQTRYLHNNRVIATVGQKVSAGETIAYAGGRGPKSATQYNPHLHFEVIQNGNKIDPEKFLTDNGVNVSRKPGL